MAFGPTEATRRSRLGGTAVFAVEVCDVIASSSCYETDRRGAPVAARLVRVSAACGLSIFGVVLWVSPKGLAAAVAFLAPVFVPALVGVAMALIARINRPAVRVRLIVSSALMIPGFALATFLAANYSPSASDTPAPGGQAAAYVVEVLAPLGAALALGGLVAAGLMRRRAPSSHTWVVVIGTGALLILVTAMSVAVKG